jgi:multicomponent Na+:H+ antiporter subunit F
MTLLEGAVALGLALLALSLLAAFARLVRGPSVPDRIVALDLIAATLVAAAIVHAIGTGLAVFVDVAIAVALVSYLGTVALAHAIESGGAE